MKKLMRELAMLHVTLSVTPQGKLKYEAPCPVPTRLVQLMAKNKKALILELKNQRSHTSIKEVTPPPIPAHLALIVTAAEQNKLPRGVLALPRGFVVDVNVYVLAWAAVWPADSVHVLSRLEEVATALT